MRAPLSSTLSHFAICHHHRRPVINCTLGCLSSARAASSLLPTLPHPSLLFHRFKRVGSDLATALPGFYLGVYLLLFCPSTALPFFQSFVSHCPIGPPLNSILRPCQAETQFNSSRTGRSKHHASCMQIQSSNGNAAKHRRLRCR